MSVGLRAVWLCVCLCVSAFVCCLIKWFVGWFVLFVLFVFWCFCCFGGFGASAGLLAFVFDYLFAPALRSRPFKSGACAPLLPQLLALAVVLFCAFHCLFGLFVRLFVCLFVCVPYLPVLRHRAVRPAAATTCAACRAGSGASRTGGQPCPARCRTAGPVPYCRPSAALPAQCRTAGLAFAALRHRPSFKATALVCERNDAESNGTCFKRSRTCCADTF